MAGRGTRYRTQSGTQGDVKGAVLLKLFRVIAKKSVPSVLNEKALLASL